MTANSYAVLAWRNLADKKTADVPAPQRIVSSRAPQWSEDGKTVYIGIGQWDKHAESVSGDPANVEVWHSKDVNPRRGSTAIAVDETPYETDGMFGRRYSDVYKVDLATGARTVVAKRVVPPGWHSLAI
jgi:hypothetical protein